MNEAQTRRVSANHFFGGLRLGFHALEPRGGFLKLLAERRNITGVSSGYFLAQFIRLLLKLLLLRENIGLLKISARAAGVRHQLFLAVRTALELGNHGVGAVGFLVGAAGEKNKNSGDQESDSKKRRHANLQSAFLRKSNPGHLL